MTSHITAMEKSLQQTKRKFASLSGDFKKLMLNADATRKLMKQAMKLDVFSPANNGPRNDNYSQQNNSQQQYNDCLFTVKDQDTLPVSVPTKDVPSAVPSQHQSLLQVLNPCPTEQVEYDIEFDSYEYTDGIETVKNRFKDHVQFWEDSLKPSELVLSTIQFDKEEFTFDRFADDTNHKIVRLHSKFWVPGTGGVDALAFDWSREKRGFCPRLYPTTMTLSNFNALTLFELPTT
ncbi:unnamed protein product [Mytilus coruscus]|uniref:Uncharacterized protein n=1 Tax=Mytilus coruscus TaxID=42192 RepID=A0A6J8E3V9_MYTCO|nr:unnamed protein product [Mytilus coruscus]